MYMNIILPKANSGAHIGAGNITPVENSTAIAIKHNQKFTICFNYNLRV